MCRSEAVVEQQEEGAEVFFIRRSADTAEAPGPAGTTPAAHGAGQGQTSVVWPSPAAEQPLPFVAEAPKEGSTTQRGEAGGVSSTIEAADAERGTVTRRRGAPETLGNRGASTPDCCAATQSLAKEGHGTSTAPSSVA
mmetsp:Transcript_101485/g.326153  ORF Transcript_101485/g.326153 Transcript_101485/m.326153 type:complete len:138 (+) Transcript_101485:199-612(+)